MEMTPRVGFCRACLAVVVLLTLAVIPRPAAAQADATDPEEGATAEEAQAQPESGVLAFFSKTELSGLVDMYFSYNFNEPVTGSLTPLRNFDFQHDQFSFALVEVRLVKPPTSDDRIGFRVDLDYGPVTDWVHAAEPGSPDIFRNIQQGYLSYLAPAGNGLQIDVGKFVTQHGAEVIESIDNWNYSRSLMFSWAIPYYHQGLRLTYPVDDRLTLAGYIVNGWNNASEDNNDQKTFGVQAVINVPRVTIVQNYMVGPEQPANDDDVRQLADTTVTVPVNDRLSLMANYDYGRDEVLGESVNWQGIAAYAKVQANDHVALVPRFEWYDDDDGFTTGVPQTLKDFTLTFEVKHSQGLIMRTEYRRDWSDENVFEKDGIAKDSQHTFTIGLVYGFSTE